MKKTLIKRESQPYLKMCPDLKRQYTITCEQDMTDIIEGFCPYYAVFWSNQINSMFWKDEKFQHRPEYIVQATLDLELLKEPDVKDKDEKKIKKSVSFDIFNEIMFYDKYEHISEIDLYECIFEDYYDFSYKSREIENDDIEERSLNIQLQTQNRFSDLDVTNFMNFF